MLLWTIISSFVCISSMCYLVVKDITITIDHTVLVLTNRIFDISPHGLLLHGGAGIIN